MIEARQRWCPVSDDVSYFEDDWKLSVAASEGAIFAEPREPGCDPLMAV
jgi:hypothetical protein